jgi:hypothetical protein
MADADNSTRESDGKTDLKRILWISGLFVSWFGFIAVSTYYRQFGTTYHTLDIPIQHIFNRGITILTKHYVLVAVISSIFVILYAEKQYYTIRLYKFRFGSRLYTPLLLAASFSCGWYTTHLAAHQSAIEDMYLKSTTLSSLIKFSSDNKRVQEYVNRLIETRKAIVLYSSNQKLIIFQEPTLIVSVPKIPIHLIILNKGDIYATRPPI